jgi:hypothetical protein
MVLSGVNLTHHSANARTIIADDYEKVFGNISDLFVHLHNFDVRESLTIRAHFVLAFYDKNALFPQNSVRLASSIPVQIQHGLMVLAFGLVSTPVVTVMRLKWLMRSVSRSAGGVHIGRIKYDTINLAIFVGQLSTIHASPNISRPNVVHFGRNVPPKHSLPIGDIGNDAARTEIQPEDFREHPVVAFQKGTED